MKDKNRIGYRTLPWGTPLITFDINEWVLFKRTHWVLFDRKHLIHLRTFPCIPWLYNFVKRRLWGTVSKTPLMSKYKVSTGRDESIYCDHWSKISSNCITQDLPALKPYWQSDSKLLSSKCLMTLSLTIHKSYKSPT